jgi:AraC family transcriptional regulator
MGPTSGGRCFCCAEMLAGRLPAKSNSVASLTKLLATYLVETYTNLASKKKQTRGGLPIRQLRRVEDYINEHLAEEMALEKLSTLVELSPFHFSRLFKETTGVSPLQFVTRARITRAQQLIRETPLRAIQAPSDAS